MKNCKRLALLLILLLIIAIMSTLFVACDFAEGEPYYGTYYGGKVNGKFINPTTIDKKYFNIEDQHLTYSYSDGRITLSSNAQVIFAENFQIHYLEKYLMSSVGWKGSIWQRDGYFNSTLYYSENNKILDTLNFYSNGEYKFVHSEPNGGFECGNYYLRSGVLTICCKESMEVSVVPNSERYWYIDKNYSIYAGVSVKESSSLIGENSTSPNPDSGNNGNNGNGSSQEKTYTVTWKNYNGTILKTDYNVPEGSTPTYDGNTPTREAEEGYNYIFKGWSPSVSSVYEDKTFTAQYDATLAIPNLPTNTQPILESANTSFEGDGTEESPYLIKTSAQLLGMGAYADKHFALANDVTLPLNSQDRPNFTPLFSDEKPFNGTFDGRGYTIKNLYIYNTDTYYTGLFASVGENGVVKNLELADVKIFGANYVGGIAGLSFGSIIDCEVSGNITYVPANDYQVYIGGIAGRGSLDKCNSAVEIKVFGFNSTCYVGGLTGYATSKTISDSSNIGNISVMTDKLARAYVGGLVGSSDSSITSSYNTGAITVNGSGSSTYVGGLAGYGSVTIKNSHWLYYEDGAPVNAVGYNSGMGVPTNIGATKHMSISEFYNLADTLNEGLTTPAFEHKTSSSLPTLIKKEN